MWNYKFLGTTVELYLLSTLFIAISLLIPSQSHWKRGYPYSVGRWGAAKRGFALGGEDLLLQKTSGLNSYRIKPKEILFTPGNKCIFSQKSHSFHLRSQLHLISKAFPEW